MKKLLLVMVFLCTTGTMMNASVNDDITDKIEVVNNVINTDHLGLTMPLSIEEEFIFGCVAIAAARADFAEIRSGEPYSTRMWTIMFRIYLRECWGGQ